jgi:hypothetical protein
LALPHATVRHRRGCASLGAWFAAGVAVRNVGGLCGGRFWEIDFGVRPSVGRVAANASRSPAVSIRFARLERERIAPLHTGVAHHHLPLRRAPTLRRVRRRYAAHGSRGDGNQPIAIAVAETLEAAFDAADRVAVRYAPEKPSVTLGAGLASAYVPKRMGGAGDPEESRRGDPEPAFAVAAVRIKETYSTPFQTHWSPRPFRFDFSALTLLARSPAMLFFRYHAYVVNARRLSKVEDAK